MSPFDFGKEIYRANFTGQSDVSDKKRYRPYAGFVKREVVTALAGNASSVRLSIDGRAIGSLEQFSDQVCSGFRIRIAVKTNS